MGKICNGIVICVILLGLIIDESLASQRISAKSMKNKLVKFFASKNWFSIFFFFAECEEYEDRARKCIAKFLPFFGLDRRPARPKEFPHSVSTFLADRC